MRFPLVTRHYRRCPVPSRQAAGTGIYGRLWEIAGKPAGAERPSGTALLRDSPHRVPRAGTAGMLPPRYLTTVGVFLAEAELVKSLLPG